MPKYSEITKKVLLAFAIGGVLAVAFVAPPTLKMFGELFLKDKKAKNNREQRRRFSRSLYQLRKSRLIITKQKQDGTFVTELTEKGKRKIREFRLENLTMVHPKQWDRIWRIIIFDIPKKHRGRNALREKLKTLDFYQLQESVWVFPYSCFSEIEFLVELFNLYPYVNYLEATSIKNDAKLKRHFALL